LALRSLNLGVLWSFTTVTREVVGVFVRFRATSSNRTKQYLFNNKIPRDSSSTVPTYSLLKKLTIAFL
jgi:hypothetical protein